MSANTIRLELAVISHLFNVARTAWGMESLANPVELARGQRPRLPPGRVVGDEGDRLMEAAGAYGGEMSLIIVWAIETAMRRSEIALMRWERVNREARTLWIPEEEDKNGLGRAVPLSARALAILDSLPQKSQRRVWTMGPSAITRAFGRIAERAGIDEMTFHDLRHEVASRLFEKGLNQMEASVVTGHKTLQMLKRYTHLRAEDLAAKLDREDPNKA